MLEIDLNINNLIVFKFNIRINTDKKLANNKEKIVNFLNNTIIKKTINSFINIGRFT